MIYYIREVSPWLLLICLEVSLYFTCNSLSRTSLVMLILFGVLRSSFSSSITLFLGIGLMKIRDLTNPNFKVVASAAAQERPLSMLIFLLECSCKLFVLKYL